MSAFDKTQSVIGCCDFWDAPYPMTFHTVESLDKVTAFTVNSLLEFSLVAFDKQLLASCTVANKPTWLRSPTYSLTLQSNCNCVWHFRNKGWLGASVATPDEIFTCNFRSRFQRIKNCSIHIELDRKTVRLYTSDGESFATHRVMLIGLAYFLWVRYTRLCES